MPGTVAWNWSSAEVTRDREYPGHDSVRMDDRQCEIRRPDETVGLGMLPSEYVRRNIRFTFENDVVGARLLEHD